MHQTSDTGQQQARTSPRWLVFLSKLAFICNLFFIVAVSLQLFQWIRNEDLIGTIAILGYVMVVLFNPLVNLCYLLFFIINRRFLRMVPAWLITANILFLVMEIFYILYLNDTKHN